MTTFKNPTNGYTETVTGWSMLWTLLFGCFYFAYKGVWGHFFIGLVLGMLTLGLSWLVYPFFTPGILRKKYRQLGWTEENA